METNNKKEISGVQILRGIASLAVVLCHAAFALNAHPLLSEILMFGRFGVHIFFFISGYIIIYSLIKNQYSVRYFLLFLAKRTIRIEPMYILTIILTLLSFWGFSFFASFKGHSIPFSLLQFISDIFYIVPFTKWPFYNHVFWTLGIEFQFYILIGLVYFFSKKYIFKTIIILAFSCTCFIHLPNSYYLLTNYASIFAMGISLIEYQLSKKIIYILCFILCGLITYIHFDLLIMSLILVSTIVIILNKAKYSVFDFLGNISYSLYLLHPLVLLYLSGIFKRIFIHPDKYELTIFFTQILCSIIVSYIFYALVELPSQKLSKRIKINQE